MFRNEWLRVVNRGVAVCFPYAADRACYGRLDTVRSRNAGYTNHSFRRPAQIPSIAMMRIAGQTQAMGRN